MAFAKMMASPLGRLIRIVAGIALVVIGLVSVQGVGGIVLAVIGVLPILAGVFNVCLVAPLIGAPFSGKATR